RGGYKYQGLRSSGKACQCCRYDETEQFVAVDFVAEGNSTGLIFAYGFQDLPEWRVDSAPANGIAYAEDDHYYVVQVQVIAQVQPEYLSSWYSLQAILPMGKRCLQKVKERHLRHGQSDHG